MKEKRIPNCLKKYRKARGLQQKDVAQILALRDASIISRWEKGARMPSPSKMLELAALYRTPVEGLFRELINLRRSDLHRREEELLKKKQEGQNGQQRAKQKEKE